MTVSVTVTGHGHRHCPDFMEDFSCLVNVEQKVNPGTILTDIYLRCKRIRTVYQDLTNLINYIFRPN